MNYITNEPAGIDLDNAALDKLEAHARSKAGHNSVWLSASKVLALIALARRAPAPVMDERALRQAGKDFYNATVADSEVRITSASKEKRDIAAAAADRLRAALAQQSPAPVVAHDAPQEAAPSLLSEAYRAVQNCILALPDGQFKRDMDEWLTVRLDLIDGPDAASAISGLRPVASVVSRVGDDLRVGWLRPERCDVGTLLYCAAEPEAAGIEGIEGIAASPASQPVAPEAAQADLPVVLCVGRPFPATDKATIFFDRDVTDDELLLVNRALQSRLNNPAAPTTVPDHSERGAVSAPALADCLNALRTAWHISGVVQGRQDIADAIARADSVLTQSPATIAAGQEAANAVGLLPHDWKDRLYAAMNAAFELRENGPRDEDGQRQGIRIDDTQIGVEFAMDWLEKSVLAANAKDAEGGFYKRLSQQARDDAQRERVRDAVAEALDGLYTCGRVWSAWGYGTMSQDDFAPAGEDDDVVDNITHAAIAAMAAVGAAGQEGGDK